LTFVKSRLAKCGELCSMIAAVMGYSMAHAVAVFGPLAGLPGRITSGWSAGCYASALLPLFAGILVVCLAAHFGG